MSSVAVGRAGAELVLGHDHVSSWAGCDALQGSWEEERPAFIPQTDGVPALVTEVPDAVAGSATWPDAACIAMGGLPPGRERALAAAFASQADVLAGGWISMPGAGWLPPPQPRAVGRYRASGAPTPRPFTAPSPLLSIAMGGGTSPALGMAAVDGRVPSPVTSEASVRTRASVRRSSRSPYSATGADSGNDGIGVGGLGLGAPMDAVWAGEADSVLAAAVAQRAGGAGSGNLSAQRGTRLHERVFMSAGGWGLVTAERVDGMARRIGASVHTPPQQVYDNAVAHLYYCRDPEAAGALLELSNSIAVSHFIPRLHKRQLTAETPHDIAPAAAQGPWGTAAESTARGRMLAVLSEPWYGVQHPGATTPHVPGLPPPLGGLLYLSHTAVAAGATWQLLAQAAGRGVAADLASAWKSHLCTLFGSTRAELVASVTALMRAWVRTAHPACRCFLQLHHADVAPASMGVVSRRAVYEPFADAVPHLLAVALAACSHLWPSRMAVVMDAVEAELACAAVTLGGQVVVDRAAMATADTSPIAAVPFTSLPADWAYHSEAAAPDSSQRPRPPLQLLPPDVAADLSACLQAVHAHSRAGDVASAAMAAAAGCAHLFWQQIAGAHPHWAIPWDLAAGVRAAWLGRMPHDVPIAVVLMPPAPGGGGGSSAAYVDSRDAEESGTSATAAGGSATFDPTDVEGPPSAESGSGARHTPPAVVHTAVRPNTEGSEPRPSSTKSTAAGAGTVQASAATNPPLTSQLGRYGSSSAGGWGGGSGSGGGGGGGRSGSGYSGSSRGDERRPSPSGSGGGGSCGSGGGDDRRDGRRGSHARSDAAEESTGIMQAVCPVCSFVVEVRPEDMDAERTEFVCCSVCNTMIAAWCRHARCPIRMHPPGDQADGDPCPIAASVQALMAAEGISEEEAWALGAEQATMGGDAWREEQHAEDGLGSMPAAPPSRRSSAGVPRTKAHSDRRGVTPAKRTIRPPRRYVSDPEETDEDYPARTSPSRLLPARHTQPAKRHSQHGAQPASDAQVGDHDSTGGGAGGGGGGGGGGAGTGSEADSEAALDTKVDAMLAQFAYFPPGSEDEMSREVVRTLVGAGIDLREVCGSVRGRATVNRLRAYAESVMKAGYDTVALLEGWAPSAEAVSSALGADAEGELAAAGLHPVDFVKREVGKLISQRAAATTDAEDATGGLPPAKRPRREGDGGGGGGGGGESAPAPAPAPDPPLVLGSDGFPVPGRAWVWHGYKVISA